MRVLMASSEAVPFAKTGGLADVATGLAKAMSDAGHEVSLIIPCHRRFIPEHLRGEAVALISVELGNTIVKATVRRTLLKGSQVEVLLIDQPNFFDRRQLYTENGTDYADNAERYLFFSRAVVEIAQTLTRPQVIHANDWQTALIPALVSYDRLRGGRLSGVGTVLTIHNMAFHGQFPSWQMELTSLPQDYFNYHQLEYYGQLNLLKGGIALADMVTTVSPTYAREICRPEFGVGLDPLLLDRGDSLVGILNGVDMTEWNPATDPHLKHRYTAATVHQEKPKCKAALQTELGLKTGGNSLLFSMVSRLTDQKGLDLITMKADEMLKADLQLAFLGTGERWCEDALQQLAERYPGRVAVKIGFDEGLAHRLEAGADAYLMPSRFEPCGLNQQYSLIYGTVPVVHTVGGLADSVVDANQENIANGTATGFQFRDYHPDAFLEAVWRAVGLYEHHQDDWKQVMRNGMTRDLSWRNSALQYLQVYERAVARAQQS
ncbi:glycogen synthase GlgA [Planctomicrobium sp. SH664]|uniref:glycogen synthase GlgA n=1 Tax=Planctomicrobium sp. SH664 TaxID=3448125 RepID=UPI003F5C200D